MSAAQMVQALTEFAAECEQDYDTAIDEGVTAPEQLTIMLCALRDCRADLDKLYKRIETGLMAQAGEKRFVVEGVGEVEIKKRTKRTGWRHDEMLPVVIARVMDEPQTIYDDEGTLLPYHQIGHNVARRLRECVSFGAGKVTGLRALNLQPDEFCTEEADGYSVKLPPRAVA